MSRIQHMEAMMEIAYVVSQRSTCARRRVGCVITDEEGRVLSTGFNGVARGLDHCIDKPCPGVGMASGEGLDRCEAIHAESNAIASCRDLHAASIIYTTTEPCFPCIKQLLCTPIKLIIYDQGYAHGETKKLWRKADRAIVQYNLTATPILTSLRLATNTWLTRPEPGKIISLGHGDS